MDKRCLVRTAMAGAMAAGAFAMAGCLHFGRTEEVRTCSGAEIDAFLSRERDPREFFITVYQSDDAKPVFVGANRMPMERAVALPFEPIGPTPLPVVTAQAGQKGPECQLLTDTTAPENWVGIDWAKDVRMVPLGSPAFEARPVHVVDNIPGYLCAMSSLVFDKKVRVDTALFYARAAHGPLWPLNRDARAARVKLVMGMQLLRAFAFVQWDFPGRRLVLSSSTPYRPSERRMIAAIPVASADGGLVVEGAIDGRPRRMLFDVAGDFELAMDEPPMNLIRQVSAGELVFRQVQPSSLRERGLGPWDTPRIGLRLLTPYVVTLDNHSNTVYIEAPVAAQ